MEGLRRKIENIKRKVPVYGEILDFYIGLRELREEIKKGLRPLSFEPKNRSDETLFGSEDLKPQRDVLFRIFLAVSEKVKEGNPHLSIEVSKITESLKEEKILFDDLLVSLFDAERLKKITKAQKLDGNTLFFLLKNTVKPLFELTVAQIKEKVGEQHSSQFCPVCGFPSMLSVLKEEVGKRYLVCSLCNFYWRINRIKCPICGDKEGISHFFVEDEEAYRVDTCDNCKAYIKTLDLRKIEDFDPEIDDIRTLHLDILARKRGYSPASSGLFPIIHTKIAH